jgi:hypothetical protein
MDPMTVQRHTTKTPQTQLLVALLSAFTPAVYAQSWVPWLRWAATTCVVVIVVLVIRVITGGTMIALT